MVQTICLYFVCNIKIVHNAEFLPLKWQPFLKMNGITVVLFHMKTLMEYATIHIIYK